MCRAMFCGFASRSSKLLSSASFSTPALVHFDPQFLARADHLLARDDIDFLRAGAHEIDATTCHDVGLEAVLPQELEQLELWPVHTFLEQPPELRVPRLRQPVA